MPPMIAHRWSELQPKALLLFLATLVEGIVLWDSDGVDVPPAEPFDGAAAGGVVGVARQPRRPAAMRPQQRQDQAGGAAGVMMAAGGGVNVVADVAVEQLHHRTAANAQRQAA